MDMIKTYKAMARRDDGTTHCLGFDYIVGNTYKHHGLVIPCESGFHSCKNLADVYGYYPVTSPVFECEIPFDSIIDTNKRVSNEIKILRQLNKNEIENLIKDNGPVSFKYAYMVLEGRFKEAEKAIAEDPGSAYGYASDIVKGPWTEGEESISRSSFWAYHYAMDVLKSRFLLGEPAIKSSLNYWYSYSKIFNIF